MELQPEQILIASALGTGLVWLGSVVWMKLLKRPKPSENVMKGVVFVASTGLAFYWSPISLPDISAGIYPFVSALLVSALAVFKVSQAIYDYAWKPVTDWLGSSVSFLSFMSVKR
jgi:predicted permease